MSMIENNRTIVASSATRKTQREEWKTILSSATPQYQLRLSVGNATNGSSGDAARGHTTKQHTKRIFKEIIEETKVKSSWLTDHAILLTPEEGLLAVQEKLLNREQRRAREAANHASGVTAQNKAPASPTPSSPSESASTASQSPAAASAIVTADSPARISVPATPDLVLHPLTDDFQLTPDVPAVDPVDSLPDPAPAMPTLLDIMRGLNELTTKQETVISAVHGLETQQEKIQERITKLET